MKRILSLVLTLTLLFTFSSCGKGKIESTNSGDEKNKSNSPFSDYVGMWSESDISYEKGGLILKISIEDKKMKFDCSSTSAGPDSQIAEFSKEIELSKIKNNSVEISYDEDGWGNSGVLELTFNDDYILADFKNVVMDEMANWGFYERTYKLVKNDKAQEIITQGSNDYYENNPIEITPTYDTSKASGILASLGMTEQEFRNSCQALNPSHNDNIYIKKDTTVPFIELYELERNPNAYIGQHFVFSENPYREIICPQCNGTGYYSYAPGSSEYYCSDDDIFPTTRYRKKGVHYQKEPDISKLVPYELLGRNKTTSVDGYSVIREDEYVIFDLRDDIHSPNITNDSNVIAYMIFNGVTSNNVLQFSMISCDVIYDD